MKKNEKKTSLNLNILNDDSNLNDFLFCWEAFDNRPNRIVIHNNYVTSSFKDLIEGYTVSKNIFTEILPDEEEMIVNDKILAKITDDVYLSYVVIDKNTESSIVSDVMFYYNTEDSLILIQEIIDGTNECLLDFSEEETHNLNTITLNNNGLDIEPISSMKIDSDNQDLYYSSSTFKSLSKMVKKIKKSDKGLGILYGERGTGKTAAINYIADNLDRIIIFISNNMIDQTINNPEFRKILKKYHKPIVILDDCEMIFNEYFTKSNTVVNNLLQLVDGFLSENVTFITIFNVEDETEIDHTLTECNNLIDIVEFENLSEDESNQLAKHLGQSKKYKGDYKLIDVLNNKKVNSKSSIGF